VNRNLAARLFRWQCVRRQASGGGGPVEHHRFNHPPIIGSSYEGAAVGPDRVQPDHAFQNDDRPRDLTGRLAPFHLPPVGPASALHAIPARVDRGVELRVASTADRVRDIQRGFNITFLRTDDRATPGALDKDWHEPATCRVRDRSKGWLVVLVPGPRVLVTDDPLLPV